MLRWSPLVIVVALGLIAVLASPVLGMKTEMPTATVLPVGAPARAGYDLLRREFDLAALSPASVMLTWQGDPTALTEAHMLAFWSFGRRLAATPGVAAVSSVVNLPGMTTMAQLASFWRGLEAAQNGQPVSGAAPVSAAQIRAIKQLIAATTGSGAVVFHVTATSDPATGPARALAERLRHTPAPPGMRVWVAGDAATGYDFFHGIGSTFPWVVVFVVGATYLVLLLLLRSVVLPLKAVLVNSCTILMSFGTIVFVFQHGRFEGLLSYTGSGYVDAVMPVVMFCALFGVSMDYEVFSVTRMREEWERSHDNQSAITAGLVRSGRVILSAALLVVIVAGSFAFTRVAMTKELGVGIAVAIVLTPC